MENKNKTFEVKMTEIGKDGKVRELTQRAYCENKQQVVNFFGLNNPDILDYTIEEV